MPRPFTPTPYLDAWNTARKISHENKSWRKSPIRLFRRAGICVLGGFFFANGLFKGGLSLIALGLLTGYDFWRSPALAIVIALVMGGGVAIGVAQLMRTEDEIKYKEIREIYAKIIREKKPFVV